MNQAVMNMQNKHLTVKSTPILLTILILANLLVGLLLLPGFGESVDESRQNTYAERTIELVQTMINFQSISTSMIDPKEGSHGPAFSVATMLLRGQLLPNASEVDKLNFDHFLYFLAFLVGVVSLFFLARRWMSETAAFGATLLFNTQPVLVGHAFMNPKDVIFMSMLAASAALGFWMADRSRKSLTTAGKTLWDATRRFFQEFLSWDVWFAGLMLGFASAIRIAAPLIGIAIFAYILIHRKWQALPRFLAYGLIAFCAMIIFWPYLWPDPVGRLLESLSSSMNYPDTHLTLFKGVLFDAQDIPNLYLPVLMAAQLTITTLLMIVIGVFAFLKKVQWDFFALILIWFVLPTAAIILEHVDLYNNFRQTFFVLPPIFLITGLGFDWLLKIVKRPAAGYLMITLVLIPSLYANITLYPYQYIYYNALVGGLQGAYRNFELDYWDLAFKEAQLYLNQTANTNANIFVDKSAQAAKTFARPDLVFNKFGGKNLQNYDYIVVSTAQNADKKFAEFPTIFVVQRKGVPLAYVKKVVGNSQ